MGPPKGCCDWAIRARQSSRRRRLKAGASMAATRDKETPLSLTSLKERARTLKADVITLYFAARHRRTPWHAKLFMVAIVAYAFSPIDLIPDFVPFLGYLDELILLPIGISLALKMIPPD